MIPLVTHSRVRSLRVKLHELGDAIFLSQKHLQDFMQQNYGTPKSLAKDSMGYWTTIPLWASVPSCLQGNCDMLFSDVNRTHPYFSAAQWAKQEGVANGYEDGHLGIDENLSVGRFFAFLQKYDKARR